MQIQKQDIEGAARKYCAMMQLPADEVHPLSDPPILHWQAAADQIRVMLCMNEAMRMQLAEKEQELHDKLHEIATADQN